MKDFEMLLYPLPVRVWHGIHAAAILILIMTGVQIRYTESITLMPFGMAVEMHRVVGWVVLVDYLFWFLYQVITKRMREYRVSLSQFLSGGTRQAAYYLYGIFLGRPNPFTPTPATPLNPLQMVTYLIVMFIFLPAQIITGIFLWRGTQSERVVDLVTGLKTVDTIHTMILFLLIGFLIGHMYLGTTGPTFLSDYRAIIKGGESR